MRPSRLPAPRRAVRWTTPPPALADFVRWLTPPPPWGRQVAACVEWSQPHITPANERPPEAEAKGGKGGKAAADAPPEDVPPSPAARCGHTATATSAGVLVFGGGAAGLE